MWSMGGTASNMDLEQVVGGEVLVPTRSEQISLEGISHRSQHPILAGPLYESEISALKRPISFQAGQSRVATRSPVLAPGTGPYLRGNSGKENAPGPSRGPGAIPTAMHRYATLSVSAASR